MVITTNIKIDIVTSNRHSSKSRARLDWLDFEVQANEWEHQTFQILHQIIETSQSFGIFGLVDIDEWTGFRGGERDVLIADDNFQLLQHTINREQIKNGLNSIDMRSSSGGVAIVYTHAEP